MTATDLDPNRWFGVSPGDDGVLISRHAIREWLQRLAATCDRSRLVTLGTSTEGRPIDAVFIGEDVSDRQFSDIASRRRDVVTAMLAGSREHPAGDTPIVLVTSGIHATEVGGPQSIPGLVYWLATSDNAAARAIRRRVLTIVVPTLNPDGMDLVQRWHERTARTELAGAEPPLLYHRFAGHDNNRDWLYRNLVETRVVLDRIHAEWLPHVTLDQHQMNPAGPRFVLPPYADPWEPHVHPSIIAASSGLGLSIASDLTAAGMAGVTTGRYFDAWEPSRAIQHYRGGVRILAEAASANMAFPTAVSANQLAAPPLPQDSMASTSTPLPWPGGIWRLRDIVDYHAAAARSLLRHASERAEHLLAVQREALQASENRAVTFHVPLRRPAIDLAANQRLASMLDAAGLARIDGTEDSVASWSTSQPLGQLAGAVLTPKPYPSRFGASAYDVTTHFLPATTGAIIRARGRRAEPVPSRALDASGPYAVIDARCHAAPNAVEAALRWDSAHVWRASARAMVSTQLVEAGSWIVDRANLSPHLLSLISGTVDALPATARRVVRRDIVLLRVAEPVTADHGWTRWWLHARDIPFLEAGPDVIDALTPIARTTTVVIADTPPASLDDASIDGVRRLVDAGANVIATGGAGRALAPALSPAVTSRELDAGSGVHAPGALVRLRLERSHAIALGLDQAIPAMVQRDGVFQVRIGDPQTRMLGRFSGRDTVVSGWMSEVGAVASAPAIVEVRSGNGSLVAFAFRPLFRGQTLVTSPLVHNLIYTARPESE